MTFIGAWEDGSLFGGGGKAGELDGDLGGVEGGAGGGVVAALLGFATGLRGVRGGGCGGREGVTSRGGRGGGAVEALCSGVVGHGGFAGGELEVVMSHQKLLRTFRGSCPKEKCEADKEIFIYEIMKLCHGRKTCGKLFL